MFRKMLVLFTVLPFLMHCSNPCERLAEVTCEEQGPSSKRCEEAQAKADAASTRVQAHCSTALELVEAMKKSR